MVLEILSKKRKNYIITAIFALYVILIYSIYCHIGSRVEEFKKNCLQYYANVVERILLTNIKIITQNINNSDSDNIINIIGSIIRNDVYLYNNTHIAKNSNNLIPLNFLETLIDAGNNSFDFSIKINDIEIANSARNLSKDHIKNVYKINSTDSIAVYISLDSKGDLYKNIKKVEEILKISTIIFCLFVMSLFLSILIIKSS